MLVREQMEECTLSFSIPKQLLLLYIQEDTGRYATESARLFAAPTWNDHLKPAKCLQRSKLFKSVSSVPKTALLQAHTRAHLAPPLGHSGFKHVISFFPSGAVVLTEAPKSKVILLCSVFALSITAADRCLAGNHCNFCGSVNISFNYSNGSTASPSPRCGVKLH